MTSFVRAVVVGVAISLSALAALPARAQATIYLIDDLGVLPGGTFSQANDINAIGQVVGVSNGTAGIHAFRYDRPGLVDLGVVPGGASSIAYAINDTGQIVGQSGTSATPRAFVYEGGSMRSLGVLPGGSVSLASDINNGGDVVGYSNTGTTASHAFLYRNGTLMDLVGPVGSTSSEAAAINDRGQIVGTYTAPDAFGSFVYSAGVFQLLPQLPAGATVTAVDINNLGQITGTFGTSASYHAFSFSNGVLEDLGAFPEALFSVGRAINDAGTVVGEAALRTGGFHAALFGDDGPIDLGTLLLNGSEWSLASATGINASGQIVGFGTFRGASHAFLLTPIPEPSSFALLFAGLAMLSTAEASLRGRRRRGEIAQGAVGSENLGGASGTRTPDLRIMIPSL